MKKIKLVSDSTCDLSKELIKKHDIEIIPLYVLFGEESYFDGVDLTTEQMYQYVNQKNTLPKTAAPSPGAFYECFEKYLDLGYDIIYLGIGSKFSGTLQSAMTAKTMLNSNDIYLIDSQNLSSGSGLLLLKAAQMREQGLTASEIKTNIELLVPKVRSQFVIDTLEYLYKGGRLNALSAIFGSMLKVHPIIKVRDGVMAVGKKPRGPMKIAIDCLIQEATDLGDQIDPDFMMVTHSLAHDSFLYINEKLNGQIDVKNLYETNAGCVISSHCGKGTIGILYIMK